MNTRGLFITFEGIDGCGKTTQAMLTFRYLIARGYDVHILREPGSTEVAERIRDILLNNKLSIESRTELLLYEAARAEVTIKEIAPLLEKGKIVLCDRFYDSTTAYQGYGRKLDIRMVKTVNRIAVGNISPHLTFLFDIDIKAAQARRKGKPDRLESQSTAFFNRVRKGFLEIARKERRRIKVIDGSQSVDDIFEQLKKILSRKLKTYDAIHAS